MAQLTLTNFLTLDGVMQAPGGPQEDPSGDFTYGGWMFPFADEQFNAFITGIFSRADAFLLGRTTYQIFAGYWPRFNDPANPIASALNNLPKYVASRTLGQAEWQHSSIVRDAAGEVPALKQRHQREIQVHGSAALAQTLIQHDLVDVYHLFFCPLVLGKGKRLFGSGTVPAAFALVQSQTNSKGAVLCTYQRAGRPTFGSFEE